MMQALLEIVRLKMRLLIAAGLLLLLNIILLLFIHIHQSPAIIADQTKWSELRRQVALMGKADINSIYKQGIADLETIKGKIPLKRQFPRVLADIIEKAVMNRVKTSKISYKHLAAKDQNLPAYEMSLSVSGSYLEVKCFLAELLETDELVVVEKIALANGDQFEEKVAMDLKLTIYLREEA